MQTDAHIVEPVATPEAPRMGKWRASFTIAKSSWRVLMQDKEILWFPVLSAITTLIVYALVGVAYVVVMSTGEGISFSQMEEYTYSVIDVAFLFVLYVLSFLTINFFQAGIMIIARARFNGEDLSFGDGIRGAFSRFGALFVWSVIAATVGVILNQIASRSKIVGKIVASLLGAAWNIMTFFSLPAIVLNNASVKGAFTESASTIRKTWGETIIIVFGVGLFLGLIYLAAIFVTFGALYLVFGNMPAMLAVGSLFFIFTLLLAVVGSALSTIFKTALYEYARTGQIPAGFPPELIQNAVKQK